MKIKQLFPMMILALGLVTMIWVSPSPAADPESGWWNAGGDDPARETQPLLNPGWEGGYKTTNSRTGAVHTYQYRTDPKTGDRIESDQDYNVSKNGMMSNFSGLETTTHRDKSTHVTRTDGTGHTNLEVDKDSKGRVTSTKTYYKDGSGYETHNYDPGTNRQTSVTIKHSGTTTTTNYGADGKAVSSESFDANTGSKVTKGFTNGKMTSETDKDKNGMILHRDYGLDGRLGMVQTDDPKTGTKTNTIYRPDGSTSHYEQKAGADGSLIALSKTDSKGDGSSSTVNYASGCPASAPQNCKIASSTDNYGGGAQTKKTFDPASGKLVSQTNTGPNNYQESTTYDPKTGFMTSKSKTQADGSIQKVNYSGNCSQFGGSDCHKISEVTSDAKTGKITAAKSCDNQGNCKDIDPKSLIWAGGPVNQPGQQAAVPSAGNPRDQPPPQPPTKNPDGSTTAVTKNPDGSTKTVTTKPDGSMMVKNTDNKTGATTTTEFGKDGKTQGIQTFDASGKQTSATAFGQDGNKTLFRTFDNKGGSVSTHFNPDGSPASVDTVDPKGKLTTVQCDAPGKCAKALNQQPVQGGAKAFKADTKPQGLTATKQNVKADVLKQIGDKPDGNLPGGNDKKKTGETHILPLTKHDADVAGGQKEKGGKQVQSDVLGQIEGKPHGDVKESKDKVDHAVNKDKVKQGVAIGEISPGTKSGDKEKSGVMHNMPYSENKPKVQESASGNKKVQNHPVQKFKEKKKKWHYPAGSTAPHQVVR